MKKKKIILTKKIIIWHIIDIICIIGIIFYYLITFLKSNEIILLFTKGKTLSFYLIAILLIILFTILKSIKILVIYFILRFLIKKHIISKNIFTSDNDITYYRNILKDISPATISLLMDLELENFKDIEAMKLYYELKNIIFYDNDNNIIINEHNNLIFSDQILLKYFYNPKYQTNDKINEWKRNVILENIDKGL